MPTYLSAKIATAARLVMVGGVLAAGALTASTASAQLQGKGGNYWTTQVSPAVQREQLRKMREGRSQRTLAKTAATPADTRAEPKRAPPTEVTSDTAH